MQGGLMLAGGFAVGSIMDTDELPSTGRLNSIQDRLFPGPAALQAPLVCGKRIVGICTARPALEAGSGKGLLVTRLGQSDDGHTAGRTDQCAGTRDRCNSQRGGAWNY